MFINDKFVFMGWVWMGRAFCCHPVISRHSQTSFGRFWYGIIFLGISCQVLEQIGLYRYSHSFSRSGDFTASKKKKRNSWKFLNHSWTPTGQRWKITWRPKLTKALFKLWRHINQAGGVFFLFVPKGLTWIFSQNNSDAKLTDCNINTCEDHETGKPS